MSNQNEILDVNQLSDESAGLEAALRPATLDEFVGQEKLKENLRIFIAAAKSRKEALDHCLFYAPPGLGKTTLANILAREMGVNMTRGYNGNLSSAQNGRVGGQMVRKMIEDYQRQHGMQQ